MAKARDAGPGIPDVLTPASSPPAEQSPVLDCETATVESAGTDAGGTVVQDVSENKPRKVDVEATAAPVPQRQKFRTEAPECPQCRQRSRVYKTAPHVRYCICDHCGHQFQEQRNLADSDPFTSAVKDFCESLAATDPIIDPDTQRPVVPVPLDSAQKFLTFVGGYVTLRKPVRRAAE